MLQGPLKAQNFGQIPAPNLKLSPGPCLEPASVTLTQPSTARPVKEWG